MVASSSVAFSTASVCLHWWPVPRWPSRIFAAAPAQGAPATAPSEARGVFFAKKKKEKKYGVEKCFCKANTNKQLQSFWKMKPCSCL